MPQPFKPLGNGREIVADRASAADEEIGSGKVFVVQEGGQQGAHGAEGRVGAECVGLSKEPIVTFHEAGGPPGAVGVKGADVWECERHHGHGAEVFHGSDEAIALRPSGPEALVLGQEKVPEAEGGGGTVEAQPAQAFVAFDIDVTGEGTAVPRFAEAA
jgi:hypothetical protein